MNHRTIFVGIRRRIPDGIIEEIFKEIRERIPWKFPGCMLKMLPGILILIAGIS